jgi:transglutaminase superfamily protein
MSGAYLRVLVTVAVAQATVSLALRMMPPAALRWKVTRLRSFAQLLVRHTSPQDVVRAIEAVGRRLPRISTCLVRAFVAELLLGSPARPLRLTIGVKQTPDGLLESHAWVTDQDSVLIGAPCEGFVPIVEWSTW